MGWRNRVLSCLDTAQKELDLAKHEARSQERGDGQADPFEIALRAVDVQHAMQELLAEVLESCAPFSVPTPEPSRVRVDKDKLLRIADTLRGEWPVLADELVELAGQRREG